MTRLEALLNAKPDSWIALSADESRIVAEGATFEEVAQALDRLHDDESVVIHIPSEWP
jgi:hypothetical protein